MAHSVFLTPAGVGDGAHHRCEFKFAICHVGGAINHSILQTWFVSPDAYFHENQFHIIPGTIKLCGQYRADTYEGHSAQK